MLDERDDAHFWTLAQGILQKALQQRLLVLRTKSTGFEIERIDFSSNGHIEIWIGDEIA